ncbi:MAG: mechanosensitive ion channel domain-containing protein [Acidobacteriota bacterium]
MPDGKPLIQTENRKRVLRLSFLATCVLIVAGTAWSQMSLSEALNTGPSASPSPEPGVPAAPDASSIIRRSLEMPSDIEDAQRALRRATDLESVRGDLEEARSTQSEFRQRLADLERGGYQRLERISSLHDQALAQGDRLSALGKRLAARVAAIEALRREWLAKRAEWQVTSQLVARAPELASFAGDQQQAFRQIEDVVRLISQSIRPVLVVQQEIQTALRVNQTMLDRLADLRLSRRAALLHRSQPPFFSPRGLDGVAKGARSLPRTLDYRKLLNLPWVDAHIPVFLLQFVLIAAIAFAVRRVRKSPDVAESFPVLRRPEAIGVFVSTAVFSGAYQPTPLLWEFLMRIVLVASGARLAGVMFKNRRKRILVSTLAAIFPLPVAIDLFRVPDSAARLLPLIVGLGGAVMLLILAHRHDKVRRGGAGFSILLRTAAAVLIVAFVAELAGYSIGARWLIDTVLASGFVIVMTVILIRIGQGSVRVLLRQREGRFKALSSVGYRLSGLLVWFIRIALTFGASLYLLDIWEIAPSPLQTWQKIMNAGIHLGTFDLTVSRMVVAFLAVYLAAVTSTIVRGLFRGEMLQRRGFDAGVRNSIVTLTHYGLIFLGLMFALVALGFRMQNLAIIVGALGVGIGFGLQNIVNNFVSGLILLFERPVRTGDIVVMDGTWGVIRRIGLRSTIVRAFDDSELIVPNSDFISEKVTNWTLSSRHARLSISVGVAYGSDVTKVFEILASVAAGHDLILKEPAPEVLFLKFGDSSLDFEVRIFVEELAHRFSVTSDVLREIDRRFREENVEIPFPQRDLHIRSIAPDLSLPVETRSTGDKGGSDS